MIVLRWLSIYKTVRPHEKKGLFVALWFSDILKNHLAYYKIYNCYINVIYESKIHYCCTKNTYI